jgi:TRAP-type C4-dicarboxylate transport system permease small subunit
MTEEVGNGRLRRVARAGVAASRALARVVVRVAKAVVAAACVLARVVVRVAKAVAAAACVLARVVVRVAEVCFKVVRVLVYVLAGVAGLGILGMMTITCADVILRQFDRPITGALDIVKFCLVLALAGSLPYTTAVKGHVAIEYFFLKLRRPARIVMDTLMRLLAMGLFALLSWDSMRGGIALRRTGDGTATLQIPLFWFSHVIAVSCAVVVLVILYNLTHPGREMIKP